MRKTWDGRGNQSAVEYSPAYHYAYPTHAISAVPDPSNVRATNTSLESWTVFDFSTGLMTSATDANNKITTYNYDDLLNRPTYVSHPDGGWTSYWYGRNAYGEAAIASSIRITSTTDPSGMRACFDASCSGSEDEEFGSSRAEEEHDERMRHQYNALEATAAAREGNGERYRELMANDNTLSVQGGASSSPSETRESEGMIKVEISTARQKLKNRNLKPRATR